MIYRRRPQTLFTAIALLAVFVFAVWVRLQYIAIYGGADDYLEWARENYFGGITQSYLELAWSLLESGTYSDISYPPGYPALIAILNALGIVDLQQLRVAQVVLDSTGVVAFFFLLRAGRVIRSLSLLGSLIYAAYPLWAAGSTFLLAESLSPVLLLWTFTALAYVTRSSRRAAWAGTGMVIGIAGLIRPDLLLLIGIALLWGLVMGKKVGRIWAIVALTIGFSVPVGAWGVHNRVQHGVWLFTTTSGGVGLWEGLGIIPNDYGYVLSDAYTREMLRAKGLEWHSVEADQFLKEDYFRAWRDHPEHVISAIRFRWSKILWTSESFRPYLLAGLQQILNEYGLWFSLIALVFCWRNPVALLLIAGPLVYALGSIGLIHWEPRYVRYVHIAYASAIIVIVSRCLSSLEIRCWSMASQVVGASTLVVFIALVLPKFSKELKHYRLSAEVASQLPSRLARGEIAMDPLFRGLEWVGVNASGVTVLNDRLIVETTPGRFEYQAIAGLTTKNVNAMLLTFVVDIDQGGATVGILDQNSRWLSNKSFHGRGQHEGTITAVVVPNQGVNLVVANNNSAFGVSHFTVRDLRMHLSVDQ